VNIAASAPGENDWSCKPTAAHPRPVVLVHGTAGNAATNWATYAALLHNNGYCVYALNYGVPALEALSPIKFGGIGEISASAEELKAFVTRVLQATGADKVDIIGHSQGTFMPNYYVRFLGGAQYVDHYISLAPLWRGTGTSVAGLLNTVGRAFGVTSDKLVPVCVACGQMLTGSDFVNKMSSGTVAAPGVKYLNISTRYDELVVPYTSGQLTGYPNMSNVVLQNVCPLDFTEHFEIASDPNAAQLALNFLDPAHAAPVKCKLVLPFNG
jgi:triacylglycerol lipase